MLRLIKYASQVSIGLVILLNAMTASAQLATFSGTTVDERGAAIPEVSVTVSNVETGLQREATTGNEGYFIIPLLPPGRYTLTAQRQGFSTAEIRGIVLNVNDQSSLRVQLSVGQISESIVVEGAPLIQTESATVSTLVNRQFVENMPLNGRSFNALIELTPERC